MKVLVTGSRKWKDPNRVEKALVAIACEDVSYQDKEFIVIHGGAKGPDSIAGGWARKIHNEIPEIVESVHKPNWRLYGAAAGLIRNQEMLDQEKPDICLAFWDGMSAGTRDMINRCRKANVPVRIYREDSENYIGVGEVSQ